MLFQRYSAVPQFGLPIDSAAMIQDPEAIESLFSSYDIEPQELPVEATDITPFYWLKPAYRYFVRLAHPEGPAIVEMLPAADTSSANLMTRVGNTVLNIQVTPTTIEIPNDQEGLVIAGPGPRFDGQLCVHELITYKG